MIALYFLCLLSSVPTAGNFDEQLSRVDACHVVGAAYLSEYIRLPPTVGKCDASQSNQRRVNGLLERICFPVRLCTRVRIFAKYTCREKCRSSRRSSSSSRGHTGSSSSSNISRPSSSSSSSDNTITTNSSTATATSGWWWW